MSNQLIYLASPYSHEDETVRLWRFDAVVKAVGVLMNLGHMIYSPIAHCHPIQLKHVLPTEWAYWQAYDETMLSRCDRLWILQLDGWEKSTGVKAETEIAMRLGLPVEFVAEEDGRYLIEEYGRVSV